jgi:hypothetical protein
MYVFDRLKRLRRKNGNSAYRGWTASGSEFEIKLRNEMLALFNGRIYLAE